MLVSIIIPCYNVENYLEECIQSVINQTYQNIEIICVDNNSTDNTWNILLELKKQHPTLIIEKELKPGACAARNKGLSIAHGEWIQFLDADDDLMPNKILNQINYIKCNPIVEVIISPLVKNSISNKNIYVEVSKDIWIGLIIGRAGYTCSNLYKRIVLFNSGLWDETKESSQESWLLFNLLKQNCKIDVFNKPETIKNDRLLDSISYTHRADNWERYVILREEIWMFLKSVNQLTPKIEITLKQIIFDTIRFSFKDDSKKAIYLYKKFVKGKFKPVTSISTNKKYLILFNLVGFYIVEKSRNIIGNWIKFISPIK